MDDYDHDQFQEVTRPVRASQSKTAIIGFIIGCLLLVAGFYTIVGNEANGHHAAASLAETAKAVIVVPSSPVNQKNANRVIYLSGVATTDETLADPLLGVSGNAIRLIRKVENYQWTETVKARASGSQKQSVTYSYDRVWQEGLNATQHFNIQTGHENPAQELFPSAIVEAKKITLGDFTLPAQLYHFINIELAADLSDVDVSQIQKATNKPLFRSAREIYIGSDPAHPAVGDARITLTEVLPQTVSVIGQQTGDTLKPWRAPAGDAELLLALNHKSPQAMLKSTSHDLVFATWEYRVLALVLLMLGVVLIRRALQTVAVPALRRIASNATLPSDVFLGIFFWAAGTALAWASVSDEMAAGLGGVALVALVLSFKFKKRVLAVVPVVAAEPAAEQIFPIEDDEYHSSPEE